MQNARTACRRELTAGERPPDRRATRVTADESEPDTTPNLSICGDRDPVLEPVDGDLAALVTITGGGHEASPTIVACVERAIRDELDHLIRERP